MDHLKELNTQYINSRQHVKLKVVAEPPMAMYRQKENRLIALVQRRLLNAV